MPATIPNPFDPFDGDEPAMDLILGKPEQQLTYEQVKEVINGHDPMGLLKMGAPKDEYDSEIKDILKRRNRMNSALEAREVQVLFEYWFYPDCISLEEAKSMSSALQALFRDK